MSLLGALRFLLVAAVDPPALELVGAGSRFRGAADLRTRVLFPAAELPSSSSATVTALAFPFPLPEPFACFFLPRFFFAGGSGSASASSGSLSPCHTSSCLSGINSMMYSTSSDAAMALCERMKGVLPILLFPSTTASIATSMGCVWVTPTSFSSAPVVSIEPESGSERSAPGLPRSVNVNGLCLKAAYQYAKNEGILDEAPFGPSQRLV
ncbi:hypothetical protein C8F01DRAFT_1101056 [Mycena amicta]|nr:hypothetical protein C8F01DRAFT_1101056 [Mycena amicta]